MELKDFADAWGDPDTPPVHIDPADLNKVERTFAITLPADYVHQVTSVGLPFAPHLLDQIVERRLNMHDLSHLATPDEIIEETTDWRPIGLPENLLVIGWDSMGNKFCFDITQLSGASVQNAAVYFWDHDFGDTSKVAVSFSAWIARLVKLPKRRWWLLGLPL